MAGWARFEASEFLSLWTLIFLYRPGCLWAHMVTAPPARHEAAA